MNWLSRIWISITIHQQFQRPIQTLHIELPVQADQEVDKLSITPHLERANIDLCIWSVSRVIENQLNISPVVEDAIHTHGGGIRFTR
ncbi:hypothetical protein N9260_01985 [bacterium]|nr:hypothetical protein [bacterium]